jgi:hypothetical protein
MIEPTTPTRDQATLFENVNPLDVGAAVRKLLQLGKEFLRKLVR